MLKAICEGGDRAPGLDKCLVRVGLAQAVGGSQRVPSAWSFTAVSFPAPPGVRELQSRESTRGAAAPCPSGWDAPWGRGES